MAGFEPAASCSQIRSSVLLGGAERGLLCCLAGMMAAGRRPTWPGTGGRWLPTWLPGNLLARLMFDLPNMRANSFAGCLGASSRYRCGSAVVLGWATSCKIVRLWLGSRVGCGPRPRSSYLEEPSGAHRAACDDAVGQGVGHTLWYRGVRVGCGAASASRIPATRRSCSACTSARRRPSCRVASTNRSSGGARMISSSSCRSASGPAHASSTTGHNRSSSGARSASSRSVIDQPSRVGRRRHRQHQRRARGPSAATRPAPTARTAADPAHRVRPAPARRAPTALPRPPG